jgi:hypothetical protein
MAAHIESRLRLGGCMKLEIIFHPCATVIRWVTTPAIVVKLQGAPVAAVLPPAFLAVTLQ